MRRGIRILSFAVAAALALQVLPWPETARGFLGLSPVLGMGGALAARWRQTRTMLEARALVPEPIMRLPNSVRMGQVPVRVKPARSTASSRCPARAWNR